MRGTVAAASYEDPLAAQEDDPHAFPSCGQVIRHAGKVSIPPTRRTFRNVVCNRALHMAHGVSLRHRTENSLAWPPLVWLKNASSSYMYRPYASVVPLGVDAHQSPLLPTPWNKLPS